MRKETLRVSEIGCPARGGRHGLRSSIADTISWPPKLRCANLCFPPCGGFELLAARLAPYGITGQLVPESKTSCLSHCPRAKIRLWRTSEIRLWRTFSGLCLCSRRSKCFSRALGKWAIVGLYRQNLSELFYVRSNRLEAKQYKKQRLPTFFGFDRRTRQTRFFAVF